MLMKLTPALFLLKNNLVALNGLNKMRVQHLRYVFSLSLLLHSKVSIRDLIIFFLFQLFRRATSVEECDLKQVKVYSKLKNPYQINVRERNFGRPSTI